MPGKTIKKAVKKAVKNYKSKRRVKKLLKSGNPEEKYDSQGNIIFKGGGKIKKKREPLKNKAKRKIAQVKNRKVEKKYEATHNTDLYDKGNPKDRGYSNGGFIQHD